MHCRWRSFDIAPAAALACFVGAGKGGLQVQSDASSLLFDFAMVHAAFAASSPVANPSGPWPDPLVSHKASAKVYDLRFPWQALVQASQTTFCLCIVKTAGHEPPSAFKATQQAWSRSTSRRESFPDWRKSDLLGRTAFQSVQTLDKAAVYLCWNLTVDLAVGRWSICRETSCATSATM